MKKLDLGQAVGVVANLGVIAGIVFLAFEIRGATRATQAETLQTASALDQEFLLHVSSNPDISQLWITYYTAPETLSAEEKIQAGWLFAAIIRRLENIYLQYQLGALSEESWQSRHALFVGMATSPGYSTFLESPIASNASPLIIEYMNQLRSSR